MAEFGKVMLSCGALLLMLGALLFCSGERLAFPLGGLPEIGVRHYFLLPPDKFDFAQRGAVSRALCGRQIPALGETGRPIRCLFQLQKRLPLRS